MDQALELRRMAASRREAGLDADVPVSEEAPLRIVAVTSGKGGVGKTSFTINFAMALAERGLRVAVLDADLGLANVNVALGMTVRTSLHDVVRGEKQLEEIIVEGPGGIQVIPGGSGVAELANLDDAQRTHLLDQLRGLSSLADVLLIDTAAGLGRNVLAFAAAADTVIVVTVPEPPAIADAYGVIKALLTQYRSADVRLVVNRTLRAFEGKAVYDKLSLVVRRFLGVSIRSMGHIPDDEVVPACVRQQRPFLLEAPESPSAQAVRRLASEFADDGTQGRGLKGFLNKLVGWFR